MGDTQNWRTDVNAEDYFLQQKKQLQVADRRPVIRKAADLVGPGIAASAIPITYFDDILVTYNGYYSYTFVDGATSTIAGAPNLTDSFVGFVTVDALLGGVQVFYSLDTGMEYRRLFLRSLADPDFITFDSWESETDRETAAINNRFQTGFYTSTSLANATMDAHTVTFSPAFTSTPLVVASLSAGTTVPEKFAVAVSSFTPTDFVLRIKNVNFGGPATISASWIAMLP